MSDKTQLEKEIERQEMTKRPISALMLIAFLSISLGALGVYTFKLKEELLIKEQEIVLIKRNFNNEKAQLLNKIRRLKGEEETPISDLTSTPSQALPKKVKKPNEE